MKDSGRIAEEGVTYYATGDKYINQALFSAKSLKRENDTHVTIYTDQDVESAYVDNIVKISASDYPFYDRITYFKQTPYEKTIYLDTDTFVAGDINPVFELLDRVDIAAAFNESHNTAAQHTKFDTVEIDAPDSFPEYQCGVIGYQDNHDVQHFFDDWRDRYQPYKSENLLDQPHFRETLFQTDVAIGTLPTEYNSLVNFGGYLHGAVKIIHYAGSSTKIRNDYSLTLNDFDELTALLNESAPQDRIFYYNGWAPLVVRNSANGGGPLSGIITLLLDHGFIPTIKRVISKGINKINTL